MSCRDLPESRRPPDDRGMTEKHLASSDSHQRIPLSASLITQILVALACLMGGFILPSYLPDFGGVTQTVLFIAGGVAAVAAVINALYGRRISRVLTRVGMRSRVVIPREGLVYLGIMLLLAIGGLVGHSNMLLLVFGLMAGPWVMNGWFVYMALRGVRVDRQIHDRVMAGESLTVNLTAHNSKSWITSRLLDIRDEINQPENGRSDMLGAGIVTIVRLPAGEKRTGHYRLVFDQRGEYRLGPIRISSRFPLGIGERAQIIPEFQSILVRPRIGRLRPAWFRRHQDRADSRQTHSMRRGVFDDEFHRIRELRPGDSPRSIHWRTTARRGELMVQEFHQNRDPEYFVLLDLCEDPEFTSELVELAVSTAATLCTAAVHGGSDGQLLLAVTGSAPDFIADTRPARFAQSALDALAVCQPAASPPLEPALRQLADTGALMRSRGVIITSRPEFCRLTISEQCTELVPDAVDIISRLMIVPADRTHLDEIVMMDSAHIAPRQDVPQEQSSTRSSMEVAP